MQKAFSVFDSKAGTFSPPFFQPALGLAVRMFTDLANDKATTVGKYPTDFSLFYIGDFDEATGVLAPLTQHQNLGLAASFIAPLAGLPLGRPGVAEVRQDLDGKSGIEVVKGGFNGLPK